MWRDPASLVFVPTRTAPPEYVANMAMMPVVLLVGRTGDGKVVVVREQHGELHGKLLVGQCHRHSIDSHIRVDVR